LLFLVIKSIAVSQLVVDDGNKILKRLCASARSITGGVPLTKVTDIVLAPLPRHSVHIVKSDFRETNTR
jgi:hypothetical protein